VFGKTFAVNSELMKSDLNVKVMENPAAEKSTNKVQTKRKTARKTTVINRKRRVAPKAGKAKKVKAGDYHASRISKVPPRTMKTRSSNAESSSATPKILNSSFDSHENVTSSPDFQDYSSSETASGTSPYRTDSANVSPCLADARHLQPPTTFLYPVQANLAQRNVQSSTSSKPLPTAGWQFQMPSVSACRQTDDHCSNNLSSDSLIYQFSSSHQEMNSSKGTSNAVNDVGSNDATSVSKSGKVPNASSSPAASSSNYDHAAVIRSSKKNDSENDPAFVTTNSDISVTQSFNSIDTENLGETRGRYVQASCLQNPLEFSHDSDRGSSPSTTAVGQTSVSVVKSHKSEGRLVIQPACRTTSYQSHPVVLNVNNGNSKQKHVIRRVVQARLEQPVCGQAHAQYSGSCPEGLVPTAALLAMNQTNASGVIRISSIYTLANDTKESVSETKTTEFLPSTST